MRYEFEVGISYIGGVILEVHIYSFFKNFLWHLLVHTARDMLPGMRMVWMLIMQAYLYFILLFYQTYIFHFLE